MTSVFHHVPLKKKKVHAGEIVQWTKMPAAKPNNLSEFDTWVPHGREESTSEVVFCPGLCNLHRQQRDERWEAKMQFRAK